MYMSNASVIGEALQIIITSYKEPPQESTNEIRPTNTILVVTGTPANQIGPHNENYS